MTSERQQDAATQEQNKGQTTQDTSMDEITEADIEQAKQEVKENYREKTGETLPDHVVENLHLLSSQSLTDYAELEKRMQKSYETSESEAAAVLYGIGVLAGSGLIGVYASRFFAGWPAQVAGGLFVALLAFATIGLIGWVIDRVR